LTSIPATPVQNKVLTPVDTWQFVTYSSDMIEVRKTTIFTKWFESLKDRRAKARIQVRIDRVEMGHFGDVEPVGEGVSELRIFYGPGYRVYFVQPDAAVVILLSGGDKDSQQADIVKAKEIAKQLEV
jgi:putative addiction module killer protein